MEDLRVDDLLTIPARELEWRFDPAGGPGGQHANKSATRVELRYDIANSAVLADEQRQRLLRNLRGAFPDGVVVVAAAESRSQWRNRQIARRKLVEQLAAALRPAAPPRRRTRPTRASRERRLAAKRRRAETKQLRRKPRESD